MKKIFLLAVVLLGAASVEAQTNNDVLQVVNKDGSSKNVNVTNKTKITFDTKKMYVSDGSSTSSFFLSKMELMKFGQVTGIKDLTSDSKSKVRIAVNAEGCTLSNIPGGTKVVCLYSVSGSLIKQVAAAEPTTIGMKDLKTGVYIVRVGKEAFKVSHQ